MSYPFELEKGSTKNFCPACKRKTFVRYVDRKSGDYIANEVGRCDRETKCGYHLKPREFFLQAGTKTYHKQPLSKDCKVKSTRHDEKPAFIPDVLFRESLQHYEQNSLFLFLCELFGADEALDLCEWYCVGTSRYRPGACVFWYVDQLYRVTRGKIMLYDKTGHRVKGCTNSVHHVMKLEQLPELHLYGQHLLRLDKTLPVAIVESEKSAILAAGYFKGFIWMASGSISTLKAERLQPLQGREIILFPDGGAFEKWQEKAEILSKTFNIRCSDLIERSLTDEQRQMGYDIGDLVVDALRPKGSAENGTHQELHICT